MKGQIFYVDYSGYKGSEINDVHLGIIFNLPNIKNMVFCIPLTSPKEKHFKSHDAYITRNHRELKHQNLIYIDQSDSIALLDQIRTISICRLLHEYKDNNSKSMLLNDNNIKIVQVKLNKYIKNIFQ